MTLGSLGWTVKDKYNNVIDIYKKGWPDLKHNPSTDLYQYEDDKCNVEVLVDIDFLSDSYTLKITIIPKHLGLSKTSITTIKLPNSKHINYIVGDYIKEWQQDKGNLVVLKHIESHPHQAKLWSPSYAANIRRRLKEAGIGQNEIDARMGIKPPKPIEAKKEPTKKSWLDEIVESVRSTQCKS